MSKRALIVDDSRSARVILGRMLEGYGLAVDSCESAEQSLEYLRATRPDVIFMDHLMPGMDGFQAVQVIKANPETASIPVLMYTSQEGELYVSQARALGAVGVLPKTVKQADVSKVLYQLRLVPERRQSVAMPEAANDDVAPSLRVMSSPRATPGEMETAIRAAIAPLLQEHVAELRRFLAAALESINRRAEQAHAPAAEPAEVVAPTLPEERPANRWPIAAALSAIALLATLILAGLHIRALNSAETLARTNHRLLTLIETQQAELDGLRDVLQTQAANQAAPSAVSASASALAELVPYGEAPLAGSRLERLRALVDELSTHDFRGTVKVTTYVGEFCLAGNSVEGFSLAPEDTPFRRCDLVGNPYEDNLTAAQRQSLAFANFVASLVPAKGDQVRIEVVHEGRKPRVAYPAGDQLTKITAGDWNKIAAQNNRVEFATEASI